jgi:hypothetical protein
MTSRIPDHDPDELLSVHEMDQLVEISCNLKPDELPEAVDVLSIPSLRELARMAKASVQRQAHVLSLAQNRLRALEN